MLSIASATYAFAPVAPLNPSTTRSASVKMESVADLKTLSEKLNPVVGFWEPIGAQWDALPTSAKMQIIGFVGFLEMFSETSVRSASCPPPQHFLGLQQRQNIRLQPSQQEAGGQAAAKE